MSIRVRATVALLAVGGLGLGLLGSGVHAAFTDGASATQTVKVGTFGITVAATNGGTVTGSAGSYVVTLASPDIQSSAAGTAPLTFSVKSVGSMPAVINVTKGAAPTAPFTDLMVVPAAVTLAQNFTQGYSGGIGWPVLANADLGKSATVTYYISATEVGGAPAALADGTVQIVNGVLDVVNVKTWKTDPGSGTASYTVLPGDTIRFVSAMNTALATADANGVLNYHGTLQHGTGELYLFRGSNLYWWTGSGYLSY